MTSERECMRDLTMSLIFKGEGEADEKTPRAQVLYISSWLAELSQDAAFQCYYYYYYF